MGASMYYAEVDQDGHVRAVFMGGGIFADGLVEISESDYLKVREGGCYFWQQQTLIRKQEVHDSLDNLRTSLKVDITLERDRREATVFRYRGKAIDCDPRAVQRITAAALAAQAALATGQPFSLDWTCADNSVLTLDAAGVAGMPLALAAYADALHRHARGLKQAVLAAEDVAALAAIDIQTGWPEQ